MNIFDCHYHPEPVHSKYNIQVSGKNIIFNSVSSYRNLRQERNQEDSVALIFDYRNNFDFIKQEAHHKRINALKIHSRIQQLTEADYPDLVDHLEELKPSVPIIIDTFYYGADLEYQPSLFYVHHIAKKFSTLPVVIAHAGGYEALKYFYHLKSLENVYFDLSFSLAYLRYTSIFTDLQNLIRFGDENKILFGTDFPFIDAKEQLDVLISIFDQTPIAQNAQEKILYENARKIFKQ